MTRQDVVRGADAAAPVPEDGSAPGFYERALTDPGFLDRFTAAYRGEDDPLDALWWLDRPGEPGPSGAAAPAAAARSARRALYGPGTDPAALERYERAAAVAERSRTTAVAALGRLPVHRTPPTAHTPIDRPAAMPPAPAAARRLPALILAAAAALVVLGAAIGFGLGRAVPPSAATPAPSGLEQFQQTVTGQDALAVFDRAAEPADLLGGDLAPLDPVTLRRLVTIGTVRFLAARTRGSDAAVCLIAAERQDRLAARCVSDVAFARAGVVLVPEDGLPAEFDVVRWQPDGRLVWRSRIG